MKRRRIVCFGDSITEARGYAEHARWTSDLASRFEREMPGRAEVHDRGVGANTTALALDRIHLDVLPLLPAIVVIEFGINDAYVFPWGKIARASLGEYQRNLGEIVRQVRRKKGLPVLVINHPITTRTDLHPQGNGLSIAQNCASYNRAAHRLAKARAVPTIDLPRLLKRDAVPLDSFWAEDGVHLSSAGNVIYGRLVFEELGRLFFGKPPVRGRRSSSS